jgi:hypothetical protein
MIIELSAEARAFGAAAAKALIQEELPWGVRAKEEAGAALTGLGAWELSPRDDPDDLEAAAALSRAAGYSCLPEVATGWRDRPRTTTPWRSPFRAGRSSG